MIEFSEKWLSKKIMCGIACGYGCCNSPTFKVTSEEHERTFLQEKYHIYLNLKSEDILYPEA